MSCCTPQSPTPWCPAHNRVWLCGVQLPIESDSSVSCSQQSLTLKCPAHQRVSLRSILLTTESGSEVPCSPKSLTPLCPVLYLVDSALSCLPQMLTLRCPSQHKIWFLGVLLTTEPDSAMSGTLQSQIFVICHFSLLSVQLNKFWKALILFSRTRFLNT